MQTKLFDTASDAKYKLTSGFRDSAFGKNKELPLHRWVPWIAGFSADFVEDCLSGYLPFTKSRENVYVLDPFAGVGTTLVEAYKQGLNVVGFEINPYASLATRLKLRTNKISTTRLARQISRFQGFMEANCPDGSTSREIPTSRPPERFKGKTQFFGPRVEKKVLFVLDFINSITDSYIRDLFRLALGSIMVSISNYSYEPSLTRRVAVGKPEIQDAPVTAILSEKLRIMLSDIEWMKSHMGSFDYWPNAKVIADSVFSAAETLPGTGIIDLVVTSPPYLNNYHYPRNTRPQLHWLGYASRAGYSEGRENDSFGKFWQTVRTLPLIDLSFQMPNLERIITQVRNLNTEKGSYGGPGWANYIATYFNDTYRFCKILKSLLCKNAVAVIVIGNSIIQGVEVKTDQFFGCIAELCGLKFEETLLLREKRTGSSIIQSSVRVDKATNKAVLYESAIILKKQ
jgi:hypothetical protein